MSQIHLVVCYDTETGFLEVDWGTTESRFAEQVFRPEVGTWDSPDEEEDRLLDELIPQLDNHLANFHLDA